MKNKLIIALNIFLISGTAQAAGSWGKLFETPPVRNYFAEFSIERAKYGYDTYKYNQNLWNDIPQKTNNINNSYSISIGRKYENNFAHRFSMSYPEKISFIFNNNTTKQYVSSLFFDIMYFMPLRQNLEAKTLIGAGLFHIVYHTQTSDNLYVFKENRICMGVRAGAGLQYNFSKKFAADLMYKYQAPFEKVKYISGISVGLIYNFGYGNN